MDNVISAFPDQDYAALAIQKIDDELKSFKGNRYAEAVKNHVAATLKHFCEENNRFAEVVYKTKRTLSDCCEEIMKGCGNHISDIDVYRGAVRNYFPNAEVEFHMTITINGDAPSEEEMNRVPKKKPAKPKSDAKKNTAKPEVPKKSTPPKPPRSKEDKPKEPEIIQLSLFEV